MPDMNDLADRLFGTKRAETTKVSSNSETITLYGTAVSDSEDGTVSVVMSDSVYLVEDNLGGEDATTTIEMPTHITVREGDEVAITLVGNSTAKSPVVSGVVGGGDRQQVEIDAAKKAADDATEAIGEIDGEIQGIKDDIQTFKDDVEADYYKSEYIDDNFSTKTEVGAVYRDSMARNLGPFYDRDFEDVRGESNPDGYWLSTPTRTTRLDDGWAHIVMDNSAGTGTMYAYMRVALDAMPVVDGTLLVEVRNLVADVTEASGHRLWFNPQTGKTTNTQVYGSSTQWWWEDDARHFPVKANDVDTVNRWCDMWFGINKGHKAEFDARISFYQGEYTGAYKPYNADTANLTREYATKTWTKQTAEDYSIGAAQRYTATIANPNLAPYMEHPLSDVWDAETNPGGYWRKNDATTQLTVEQLDDGWERVTCSGATAWRYSFHRPMPQSWVKPGQTYTVLMEIRNASVTGAVKFTANRANYAAAKSQFTPLRERAIADGEYRFQLAALDDFADCISFTDTFSQWPPGSQGSFEVRLSIYENATGEDGNPITYEGPWKPYVTGQGALTKEYSTKSELIVGLGGIKGQAVETYEEAIKPIVVGGRNLITLENTYNGWLSENGGEGSPGTANNRRTGFIPVEGGEPYVAQTWVETFNNTSDGAAVYLVWYDANETYISGTPQVGDSGSKYQVIKATAPADAAFARVSWRAHRVGYAKLEQATMPTDYTQAPEDLEVRPNLTPFGSHALTDVYDATTNPDGYWRQRPASAYVTQLSDGWLHFERANSGTGVVGSSMQIRPIPGVEPGELLTVLIEVRNNQSTAMSTTGTFDDLYVQQGTNFQLWGTTVQSSTLVNNAQAKPLSALGESFEMRFTKVVDSDHKTGDYIVGFALNVRNGAGQTLSFDFRVSVYRGGYGGGYVPYSIDDTALSKSYTRSAYFEQTAKGFDERITVTEDGLAVQETLIRQYANGVLVCKVGESVGALVNASGSFDVVSVTWSGNEPTVTGTFSTFMQSLIELGKGNTSAEIQFCDNTGNISAKPNYKGNQAIAMGADNTTIQADEDVYVAAGTEWGQYVLVSELSKMVELHAATSSTAMGNVRVSSSGIGIDYQSGLATGAGISMFDITPSSGDPYPHMEIMSSGDIDFNAGKGVRILGPNLEGTPMRGVFFGTKILNPNNSATMTLFTAAECQSMFGRALSQTKDVIIVQNGDTGAYSGQITGGTNASGALMASINPTKSGPIRYQYIVILGA